MPAFLDVLVDRLRPRNGPSSAAAIAEFASVTAALPLPVTTAQADGPNTTTDVACTLRTLKLLAALGIFGATITFAAKHSAAPVAPAYLAWAFCLFFLDIIVTLIWRAVLEADAGHVLGSRRGRWATLTICFCSVAVGALLVCLSLAADSMSSVRAAGLTAATFLATLAIIGLLLLAVPETSQGATTSQDGEDFEQFRTNDLATAASPLDVDNTSDSRLQHGPAEAGGLQVSDSEQSLMERDGLEPPHVTAEMPENPFAPPAAGTPSSTVVECEDSVGVELKEFKTGGGVEEPAKGM